MSMATLIWLAVPYRGSVKIVAFQKSKLSSRISGEVGMDTSHQPLGGTGTRVSLYIDGVEKYTKDLVGTDGTQFKFDLPEQEIKKGTIVDFVISARDATSKIANFTGQIYEISANPWNFSGQ